MKSIRPWLLSSCAALLATATAGCSSGAGAKESSGSSDEALYPKTSALWSDHRIHVCFENPSGATAQQRAWIQDAVDGSWANVAGVRFLDWSTCTSSSTGIRILFKDVRPFTSALGAEIDGVPNGMTLNVTFGTWNTGCASTAPTTGPDGRAWASTNEYCISAQAIHEFGHALGFSHEANRPDKPSWAVCDAQGENGDTTLGAWDLNSVMSQSYCTRSMARLSATDIAAVQLLYGPNDLASYWYVDGNTQAIHADYTLPASLQVNYRGFHPAAGPSLVTTTSYRAFVGDFDGDKRADQLFYAPGSTPDYFEYGTSTRGAFTEVATSISGTYVPLVGDFDGVNGDDVYWYVAGTGQDNAWWSNGASRTFAHVNGAQNQDGTFSPFVGDFDGDGRSDIFWYAPGSAPDFIWWGNASQTFTQTSVTVSATAEPIVGDFDGDGRDDVLWYSPGSATDFIWWAKAGRAFDGSAFSTNVLGTYVVTVGDFDHNGTKDILWNDPTTLDNDHLWLWHFGQRTFLDTDDIAIDGANKGHAGDFDGDGVDDVLFYPR